MKSPSNEIPDDWMFKVSDERMREIATRLVYLGLRTPSIRDRILQLVKLICGKDEQDGRGRVL